MGLFSFLARELHASRTKRGLRAMGGTSGVARHWKPTDDATSWRSRQIRYRREALITERTGRAASRTAVPADELADFTLARSVCFD